MHLSLSNFLGIKNAKIQLSDKITLIAGPNGAGKSNIAKALGYLLTGTTGVTKKNGQVMVTDDEKSAVAMLTVPGGSVQISWPSCKVQADVSLKCNAFAAGLKKPSSATTLELQKYINTFPTREDFDKEFKDADVPKDLVWEIIQKEGWDGAYTRAENKGRELKGAWSQVTGEEYGSVKAMNYIPDKYTGEPIDKLEADVAAAKLAVDEAMKATAISGHERAELQRQADDHVNALEKFMEAEKSEAFAKGLLEESEATLKGMEKSTGEPMKYDCPECKTVLVVEGTALVKASKSKKPKTSPEEYAKQVELVKGLRVAHNDAVANVIRAKEYVAKCNHAIRRLEVIGEDAGVDLEALQDELTSAKRRLNAAKFKAEADELHTEIGWNSMIRGVLHPDGLRKEALKKSLGAFNAMLEGICDVAGWEQVRIDESDLSVWYGKRQYDFASVGQQFRANVTLQLAMAKFGEAEMVVIDAADVLDKPGRRGLFEILEMLPIPSVVTMAYGVDEAPDISDLDEPLGVTYVIHDGVISPIAKAVAA